MVRSQACNGCAQRPGLRRQPGGALAKALRGDGVRGVVLAFQSAPQVVGITGGAAARLAWVARGTVLP